MTRFARLLGSHKRVVGAAVAAAAAAAVAVTQRRRQDALVLPDPGPLAAEAAVSVHNAAKGTVITTVRESDAPDLTLVLEAVRSAVTDATSSGADVLAAAIGAVEGSAIIAHLVAETPPDVIGGASSVAIEVAARQGRIAADRVRDVLGVHLLERGRVGE